MTQYHASIFQRRDDFPAEGSSHARDLRGGELDPIHRGSTQTEDPAGQPGVFAQVNINRPDRFGLDPFLQVEANRTDKGVTLIFR
ncbi:MAG: hypothetical protein WBD40_14140 [Tepidisphaeraceae bacterium]